MQRKFIDRFVFKAARISVLKHRWHLAYQEILDKSTASGNPKMLQFCEKMAAIPEEIKDHVVRKYLEQT